MSEVASLLCRTVLGGSCRIDLETRCYRTCMDSRRDRETRRVEKYGLSSRRLAGQIFVLLQFRRCLFSLRPEAAALPGNNKIVVWVCGERAVFSEKRRQPLSCRAAGAVAEPCFWSALFWIDPSKVQEKHLKREKFSRNPPSNLNILEVCSGDANRLQI